MNKDDQLFYYWKLYLQRLVAEWRQCYPAPRTKAVQKIKIQTNILHEYRTEILSEILRNIHILERHNTGVTLKYKWLIDNFDYQGQSGELYAPRRGHRCRLGRGRKRGMGYGKIASGKKILATEHGLVKCTVLPLKGPDVNYFITQFGIIYIWIIAFLHSFLSSLAGKFY